MKLKKLMIIALAIGFTSPAFAVESNGIGQERFGEHSMTGVQCHLQQKAEEAAANVDRHSNGAASGERIAKAN